MVYALAADFVAYKLFILELFMSLIYFHTQIADLTFPFGIPAHIPCIERATFGYLVMSCLSIDQKMSMSVGISCFVHALVSFLSHNFFVNGLILSCLV